MVAPGMLQNPSVRALARLASSLPGRCWIKPALRRCANRRHRWRVRSGLPQTSRKKRSSNRLSQEMR